MITDRALHRASIGRRLGWLAVASLVVLALFPFAGSVSAHTQWVRLRCDDGLIVSLTSYKLAPGDSTPNRVAVSIDGVPVSGSPFAFGTTFQQTWGGLSPTEPHTATIVVTAWDDPTNANGWSPTFELSLDACVEATATPTEAPTPTATPTEAPTPSGTVEPTASATEAPTPTPSGSVEAATGTPGVTPPSTDVLGGSTPAGPNDAWRLLLLGLAGILAGVLLLTPTPASGRAKR